MSGPLGSQQWMYSTGFYPYEIDQSLRFNDDDSAYLSRTPASAGNRKTWTWSGWVKRSELGVSQQYIFTTTNNNASNAMYLYFASDALVLWDYRQGASSTLLQSNAVYRDVSSWYHIVLTVDRTSATASDRTKLYVNGNQVTSFATATYPNQNEDSWVNQNTAHYISAPPLYFDGYLAEVNFIDGQALDPTDFGEFKSGVWIPKSYSGTYGTNGFYLDFGNSGSLGADSSGNGNNWTANNLAATDQVLDSPTNNFATLNPVDKSSALSISEGNLVSAHVSGVGLWDRSRGTIGMSSGKWYWEVLFVSGAYVLHGIDVPETVIGNNSYPGSSADSYGYYSYNGQKLNNNSGASYGATYVAGDVTGVALDLDAGTLTFYKNGVSQGVAFSGLTKEQYAPSTGVLSGGVAVNNFGQDSSFAGNKTRQGNTDARGIGDFYYAPPSGYLALCTANLPDPAINPAQDAVPADHFNTVLYTGNGSTQSITGVGFQPDFTWIKSRTDGSASHWLTDVIRGDSKGLLSNGTNAEITTLDIGPTIESDGFEVRISGTNVTTNGSGSTYVAWNWKAGGTGVSNTDGTITSTVSANTDAGFSIVTFTTDGSNTTVGTGLSSSAPLDMVVIKRRDSTSEWQVGHRFSGQGTNFAYHLELNSTSALSGAGPYFMGTHSASNGDRIYLASGAYGVSSATWVAYCFQSVEGFSKFGSYTGNGSADGPFVYTGFRPAFVMIKRIDTTENWHMQDSARSSYNWESATVYANLSNAEYTGSAFEQDYLSNGFKLRTTNAGFNTSGGTYIYMAFAEMPTKYSLGA